MINVYYLRSLGLLLAAIFTQSSEAGVFGVSTSQPSLDNTPPGHLVNDLGIDLEGEGVALQMLLQLNRGSIYQHMFGSNFPPSRDFLRRFPSLEADTFLSLGGPDNTRSEDLLIAGAASEFPESSGMIQFDDAGIDITWGGFFRGAFIDDDDFMVARITLSDDASGRLLFLGQIMGQTDAQGVFRSELLVRGGRLLTVPEPTTAAMLILGLMGSGTRWRR